LCTERDPLFDFCYHWDLETRCACRGNLHHFCPRFFLSHEFICIHQGSIPNIIFSRNKVFFGWLLLHSVMCLAAQLS
jgi:hypothetical protein